MGKKSGQPQTVNNDPWGPAQASLKLGLSEANRIYGAMNPMSQGIPAPQTPQAQFNPTQQNNGWSVRWDPTTNRFVENQGSFQQPQQMQQQSQPQGTPFDPSQVSGYNLWAPAEQEMMKTISGQYLDSNPYLDQVIARARAGVNSNFAGQGRYGSGSHIDQVMTQAEAPIRYQDYSNERGRQERAIGGLGAFQQGYANAPYADLNAFMGTVNPIAGRGSQQTQQTYSNPLAGALGGATAGAGLAMAMGGPVTWPYLLGGALLGGFAS